MLVPRQIFLISALINDRYTVEALLDNNMSVVVYGQMLLIDITLVYIYAHRHKHIYDLICDKGLLLSKHL